MDQGNYMRASTLILAINYGSSSCVDSVHVHLQKDLDIQIDLKLTFNVHSEQKASIPNKNLGMIRRSYTYHLDELSRYTTL